MNPVTLSALEIVRPGDAGYDEARPAWNLADRPAPRRGRIPRDADQVVAAVLYAKHEGLRVAAQGTGHNAVAARRPERHAAGQDPRDARRRDRRRQPRGARRGRRALGRRRRPGGRARPRRAGRLLARRRRRRLLARRRHQLPRAPLRPVGRPRARGRDRHRRRRARPRRPPRTSDLFWALRGGGGASASSRRWSSSCSTVPTVYAGALFFASERAAEALHAWRELDASAPDESTSVGAHPARPAVPGDPGAVPRPRVRDDRHHHIGDQRSARGRSSRSASSSPRSTRSA